MSFQQVPYDTQIRVTATGDTCSGNLTLTHSILAANEDCPAAMRTIITGLGWYEMGYAPVSMTPLFVHRIHTDAGRLRWDEVLAYEFGRFISIGGDS